MSGTRVAAVKDALYAACLALWPTTGATLVSFGPPGSYQPNEIVAVMGSRILVSRPTMGTTRSREEVAVTEIIFSVYVPGDEKAQTTASDRAWAMVGQLSDYLRSGTNPQLGGAAYDSWISEYDDDMQVAIDPNSGSATGRVHEITVFVTSKSRP